MSDPTKQEMRAYRASKFCARVEPVRTLERDDPTEANLSITHNGFQWQSIILTAAERLAVIQALLSYQLEPDR